MLDASEFNAHADLVFDRIVDTLDAADADFDIEVNENVLTVTCEDDSKIIVNKHELNREIWVAAKSGGFHFRWNGEAWVDTRSGESLATTLSRVVEQQSGLALAFA